MSMPACSSSPDYGGEGDRLREGHPQKNNVGRTPGRRMNGGAVLERRRHGWC